jgi:hypothetical protein
VSTDKSIPDVGADDGVDGGADNGADDGADNGADDGADLGLGIESGGIGIENENDVYSPEYSPRMTPAQNKLAPLGL